MQAQTLLIYNGEMKVQHNRRREPVIIKMFRHLNKSISDFKHRNSFGFKWLLKQHKTNGPKELINRLAHYALPHKTRRNRAEDGPGMVYVTIHMLRRAINAGWIYELKTA